MCHVAYCIVGTKGPTVIHSSQSLIQHGTTEHHSPSMLEGCITGLGIFMAADFILRVSDLTGRVGKLHKDR